MLLRSLWKAQTLLSFQQFLSVDSLLSVFILLHFFLGWHEYPQFRSEEFGFSKTNTHLMPCCRLCLAIFVWLISVGANSLTNNAAWLQ